MSRTINVGACVEGKFPVDVLRISVNISGDRSTVQQCTDAYNDAHREVCGLLAKAGIASENVRDEGFSVCPKYETVYQPNGGFGYSSSVTKGVIGYSYQGEVVAECDPTPRAVADAWNAVRNCGFGTTFDLDFGLKDPEAAQDTMLAEAVRCGRARADAIAAACGARVVGIAEVDYEYRGGRCSYRGMSMPLGEYDMVRGGQSPDFNPSDVTVECSVQMRWEIEAV